MVTPQTCPAGTDLELVADFNEEGVIVGGKFWPYARIYERPDGTKFSIHPEAEIPKLPLLRTRPCTAESPCCDNRMIFDSHTGRGERISCPSDCVCHT